jgi:hypothetical protein
VGRRGPPGDEAEIAGIVRRPAAWSGYGRKPAAQVRRSASLDANVPSGRARHLGAELGTANAADFGLDAVIVPLPLYFLCCDLR